MAQSSALEVLVDGLITFTKGAHEKHSAAAYESPCMHRVGSVAIGGIEKVAAAFLWEVAMNVFHNSIVLATGAVAFICNFSIDPLMQDQSNVLVHAYIGIWFAMATTSGYQKDEFWQLSEPDFFDGAPVRFNNVMSKNRFNHITRCLTSTNIPAPSFKDKFHWVRQLFKAFNDNMAKVFSCGWVNCLDESLSIWTSRWTCPGWMFVPRKPHPMGNEYHTICCGLCGILFALEIVEGKDAPPQIIPEYAEEGAIGGLLLRLCKTMFGTGKVVILDSGFQVLNALVLLRKRGIYASAVIKKRKTWPRFVDGDAMDTRMLGKNVGECDCWNGELNRTNFYLFTMKDTDYTMMKLMSTYGALLDVGDKRFRRVDNKKVEFFYQEPFHNHFKFRHAVDDHNNLRQGTISLETTWVTQIWEFRVFAFILAVCEVNTYLAYRYFLWSGTERMTLLRFRRKLAKALIWNEYIKNAEPAPKRSKRQSTNVVKEHTIGRAPTHAKKYVNGEWDRSCVSAYQQHTCTGIGCKKRIRIYCICSIGVWLCKECHIKHVADEARCLFEYDLK